MLARPDHSSRDKGFTLVELLIVIVILGILATVTVFAVQGITDSGEKSACKADYKTMETAIQAFYAANDNTYPASETDLVGSFLTTASSKYNYSLVAGVPTITAEDPACTSPPE